MPDGAGAATGPGRPVSPAPADPAPAGPGSPPRRARAAAIALFALLGIANGIWVARIPAIKQGLGLSDGVLGLTLLAASAGLVVVAALAGRIVGRTGSRRPAIAGGCCAALLPVALGLAPDMAALMAALFGFGLAAGLLDVAMNAQAVQIERAYRRPLMNSFHACYSFGGLGGSLFGGLFAWAGLSPAVNFLAAGVPLAVIAATAGRGLLRDRPPVQVTPGQPPEQRTRERERPPAAARAGWSLTVLMLGLLALCSLLSEGSADGWSSVYLHDSVHTTAGFAALGFAAFSVTMALGRLAGDRLVLRFGPVTVVRAGGVLAAAGLAAALGLASPAGALAGFACFGAGLSCTFPQFLSAAGHADPAHPAAGIARVAGLGYLGMLTGPVLIGGLASALGLRLALGLPVLLALGIAVAAGQLACRPRATRPAGLPGPPGPSR